MTRQEFETFLNREALEPENAVDWKQVKRAWLHNVAALNSRVKEFLADFERAGKLHISFRPRILSEPGLGTYRVQQLVIRMGTKEVLLTPRGAEIIGAWGAADLTGPLGEIRLVLVERHDTRPRVVSWLSLCPPERFKTMQGKGEVRSEDLIWKIASSMPETRFKDLTQESLFDALTEVVGGE